MTIKQVLKIAKSNLSKQKEWHREIPKNAKAPGLEFWKIIVSLIEKNIAKDVVPNISKDGDLIGGYICPVCGDYSIEHDGIVYYRYCGRCGQKIKWDKTDIMKNEVKRKRIMDEWKDKNV